MEKTSILIAEGQNHVRQAIRISLDQQNEFEITAEASCAESLLAQIGQKPSDVILLDWNLPGMHPQRIISVIRRYYPETAIFATGMHQEQGKAALAYGVDGFLLKGIPPEKFVLKLMDLLKESTSGREK